MTANSPTDGPRSQSVQVLHVDDEPGFAELVAEFVSRENEAISVQTATTVSKGLDLLSRDDVDCIVSDYEMPGQNGIEFLKAVRDTHPDLPFILYTGRGSEEVASEAISEGVTEYLQKDSGTSQYTLLANRIENVVQAARAEHSLEETLTRVTDAIYTLDTEWRFTYVNEGTEQIMGPKDELLGRRVWDAFPEAADGIIWESFHEAMDTQEPVSFEVYYDPLDLWASATAYPSETGLSVYFRDITESKRQAKALRETSERLEFALEVTDTGVWQWNLETDEVYWSDSLEQLSGIERGTFEGTFEAFQEYLHPDDIPLVEKEVESVLEDEGVFHAEFRMVREDGELIWVEGHGTVRSDGGPRRMIGTTKDITTRKQ